MNIVDVLLMLGITLPISLGGLGSAIGQRRAASASARVMVERPETFGLCLTYTAIVGSSAIYGFLISILILINHASIDTVYEGIAVLAAGLSVGFPGLLTGMGEGLAATASIAAIEKNEDLFGKSLVFAVFPETGVIYGLAFGVLVLRTIGLLGGTPLLSESTMFVVLFSAVIICFTTFANFYEGHIGVEAIGSLLKDEESFGRNIIFVVIIETIAIFGLLVAILALVYNGLL